MPVKLRKKKLPSGHVSLILDINVHGRRTKESLGLFLHPKSARFDNKETLRKAEIIRAKKEIELHATFHGYAPTNRRKESFTEYCKQLASEKPSPNTRLSWATAIRHWEEYTKQDAVFEMVSKDLMERFRTYLLQLLSPNSAQIYFSRIKTALSQAVRDNIIPANPAAYITIKKTDKLPIFLTLEEVESMAKTPCANQAVKAAFLFACFSGLRYSDVVGLTWDKVQNGRLAFSQQKTGFPELMELTQQAKQILETQRGAVPSPRVKRNHAPNTVFLLPRQSVIDKQLKAWAIAAGVTKNVSFHKSRHSFATLSLSVGNDIYTTSKLLGHKSLQTTQIYAKITDKKREEAAAKFPTIHITEDSIHEKGG
jgi:integrase